MFDFITSNKLFRQWFEFLMNMKVMGSNPCYLLKSFLLYLYQKYWASFLYDATWIQDILLDSKTSQIFLMTVHWVVNMLWLNSVMRHILQKSTWGEFFSCCSSNNKQPFYTSKLLMLPKDTILELQVRPYTHLLNGQSKCSNQGPAGSNFSSLTFWAARASMDVPC